MDEKCMKNPLLHAESYVFKGIVWNCGLAGRSDRRLVCPSPGQSGSVCLFEADDKELNRRIEEEIEAEKKRKKWKKKTKKKGKKRNEVFFPEKKEKNRIIVKRL